ncbi:NADH:flavin oxidoreductase [Thermanaerovibrio velox DSM 12556]|uniref:NADH:flavin oxidoreductase n=1 Tax=Thermanaerovibrio velox DSM 12556 TaxID=926567 RepID=H0UNB2_9BACT|nr:NADH:flavin oxidoreductase [Thermanaerovibrio velox]EHM10397.1 NADH:flavin oxidoreductase [Thermanaerovibrio velox DSM 12556]
MLPREPLEIKGVRIPNRLVAAPVASATATPEGRPTEGTLRRVKEILSSCAGLVIMEHHAVHPWGRARVRQMRLDSDPLVESHREVASLIEISGAVPLVQLNHAGGSVADLELLNDPTFRCVAPSPVPNPMREHRVVPAEMTPGEVEELPDLFVSAARRALEAGYRGVQVHCCHGYLLGQFLSPITNQRKDRYGGGLMNRARPLFQVVDALAGAFEDAIISVRLGVADFFPGSSGPGLTPEEGVRVARELASLGVDVIGISGNLCGYDTPLGFDDYSRLVMEAVGGRCAVECTGMVRSPERAERMLRSGVCHLVGVGRPLLSNPSSVAQWLSQP